MKKIFIVHIALIMILLAACGKSNSHEVPRNTVEAISSVTNGNETQNTIGNTPTSVTNEKETQNTIGNTPGNIQNGGTITIQGNWIYYLNSSNGGPISKIRTDGTKGAYKLTNEDFLCDSSASYINVVGNWIYYANDSNGGRLYKVRTDGTDETRLNNDNCTHILVVGDWVYYINKNENDSLWRIHTDGTERKELYNRSSVLSFQVVDDYIYLSDYNFNFNLSRIKNDGLGEPVELYCNCGEFIIVNDWVYYSNTEDRHSLYKARIKNNGTGEHFRIDGTRVNEVELTDIQKLTEDACWGLNIVNDWIYYTNTDDFKRLYKIRTDGTNNKKLIDSEDCSNIYVIGEWVYYASENAGATIFNKIHVDTDEQKEVGF